jgi:hypothetical protein
MDVQVGRMAFEKEQRVEGLRDLLSQTQELLAAARQRPDAEAWQRQQLEVWGRVADGLLALAVATDRLAAALEGCSAPLASQRRGNDG